jgi:hypothetical protein
LDGLISAALAAPVLIVALAAIASPLVLWGLAEGARRLADLLLGSEIATQMYDQAFNTLSALLATREGLILFVVGLAILLLGPRIQAWYYEAKR